MSQPIVLKKENGERFIDKVKHLLPNGGNLSLCLTCGACASGCPATGLENMDPRKFLRMVALGVDVLHVYALHLCVSHGDQYRRPGVRSPQAVAPGGAA